MTPIPLDAPVKAVPPPGPLSLRTLPLAALLKLALLLAVILSVLLGALLTAGHRFWREIVREQIDAQLSSVAESRRDFVREWIGRQQDRVDIIAARGVIRNYLEKHAAGVPEEPQRTKSQESLNTHVRARAMAAAKVLKDELPEPQYPRPRESDGRGRRGADRQPGRWRIAQQ